MQSDGTHTDRGYKKGSNQGDPYNRVVLYDENIKQAGKQDGVKPKEHGISKMQRIGKVAFHGAVCCGNLKATPVARP